MNPNMTEPASAEQVLPCFWWAAWAACDCCEQHLQAETDLLIQALRRSRTTPFNNTQSIDTVSAQLHLFWSTFKARPSPNEPAFPLLVETDLALKAASKSIREILATRGATSSNAAIAGVLLQLSEEVQTALEAFESYGAGQLYADSQHELRAAFSRSPPETSPTSPPLPFMIRSPVAENKARPMHVRSMTSQRQSIHMPTSTFAGVARGIGAGRSTRRNLIRLEHGRRIQLQRVGNITDCKSQAQPVAASTER
jgi:hypothetical protein